MIDAALALPIAAPLLGAALSIMIRNLAIQRIISFIALGISLASSIYVVAKVAIDDQILVSRLGGWPSQIAITLVADRFAALMLIVSISIVLLVLIYSVGQQAKDEHSSAYHPVYLVLAAGIAQAFLAGDLFNLFVAFELLLLSSYVLLTLEGTDKQIRSGVTYVVLNVLESTILLLGIGLIFAATGTVNMAELPARIAELPEGVQTGLNLLLLVAFGIKAAVFPLYFWLPDSYPTAPSSMTAVFAGLLTKVGVYAIIRTETLLFPGGQSTLLLVIAGFTMIVGVLGAISHSQMKRVLSFHIVSQIGYMIFGIGLGTEAALAATVFFILHQIPVKTSIFLIEGIIERETGSSAFDDIDGLAKRSGFLAVLFIIPALSLAGLPPFSGFLAKLGVLRAGFENGSYVITTVAIVGSLLTLVSMTKIWTGLFWGEVRPAPPPGRVGIMRHHKIMSTTSIVLVGATLVIAVLAGPLYDFSTSAAQELTDASRYVKAVLGP